MEDSNNNNSHYFCIGGHDICIDFAADGENNMQLLPSFGPFQSAPPSSDDALLFTIAVDDSLRPAAGRKLVRKFNTGNGDTLVYQLPNGGYQYIVRDVADNDCCLLIADSEFKHCQCALNGDWTMRSFGLNNALMLSYAFAGAYKQTLLIHASVAMVPHTTLGWTGFPFTAASGTGKSTHTSLWLRYIEGAQLLNDDNPVLRIVDGTPYIYGSPWSGKTPCYRNRRARLGGVTHVERATANSMERLGPVAAFAALLPACSSMKWDETLYQQLCDTITTVIETTPVFTLHCLPDEEAAHVAHQALIAACNR
jgi:hypothetical protein